MNERRQYYFDWSIFFFFIVITFPDNDGDKVIELLKA